MWMGDFQARLGLHVVSRLEEHCIPTGDQLRQLDHNDMDKAIKRVIHYSHI